MHITAYQKDYLLKAAADADDQETLAWLESMDRVVIGRRWFGAFFWKAAGHPVSSW